jgi:hypothetical protein
MDRAWWVSVGMTKLSGSFPRFGVPNRARLVNDSFSMMLTRVERELPLGRVLSFEPTIYMTAYDDCSNLYRLFF